MRALCFVIVLAGAVACGGEPLCGSDEGGNGVPICVYDDGGPGLEYCPADHWASNDGCNSCGCDPSGQVVCTTNACAE